MMMIFDALKVEISDVRPDSGKPVPVGLDFRPPDSGRFKLTLSCRRNFVFRPSGARQTYHVIRHFDPYAEKFFHIFSFANKLGVGFSK
jgi:hypothetical protein